MRLGLYIEYGGKSYDILELPAEAFVQMIPGLSQDKIRHLEKRFREYWPDPTRCRRHVLDFAAEQVGAPIDYLLLTRETIRFDDSDIGAYIDDHINSCSRLH